MYFMSDKLYNAIQKKYFEDEDGNWLSGHADELAVSEEQVKRDFPEARWMELDLDSSLRDTKHRFCGSAWLFPQRKKFTWFY